MSRRKPVVLTVAFRRPRANRFPNGIRVSDTHEVYGSIDNMVMTICNSLQATPLLVPTAADAASVMDMLDMADGIVLPGSVTNVSPELYSEKPDGTPQLFAGDHDDVTILMIKEAYKRGIPLMGICRGMQTINVAFGGSLYQSLENVQKLDHLCSAESDDTYSRPMKRHEMTATAGGWLAGVIGTEPVQVNSIHTQAVKRVGTDLVVEAVASDGIIEAISAPKAPALLIGLQWHPEREPDQEVSRKVFDAFRTAIDKKMMQSPVKPQGLWVRLLAWLRSAFARFQG